MGGVRRGPNRREVERAAKQGISEWETTIKPVSSFDPDTLADYAKLGLDPAANRTDLRNAYRESELRRLLQLFPGLISLDQLQRLTDQFAAYVGISVRLERSLTFGKRVEELWDRVIKPARSLLSALDEEEMHKELLAARALRSGREAERLRRALEYMEQQCVAWAEKLDSRKARGKKGLSEICKHHVYMTALLCEFIDPNFEPARNKDNRLLVAAEILGKPLFPPGTKFVGAVREYVDNWREALDGERPDPETSRG